MTTRRSFLAGMDGGKAHTVARLLVLTDAMGRRTATSCRGCGWCVGARHRL